MPSSVWRVFSRRRITHLHFALQQKAEHLLHQQSYIQRKTSQGISRYPPLHLHCIFPITFSLLISIHSYPCSKALFGTVTPFRCLSAAFLITSSTCICFIYYLLAYLFIMLCLFVILIFDLI